MSNLFVLNEAVDLNDIDDFKNGMCSLIGIEKENGHIFMKHETFYSLKVYGFLFANYGQTEQEIARFIEQLSPCDRYISNEIEANEFCGKEYNAFLGIDFNNSSISEYKCVHDNYSYKNWNNRFLTPLRRLLDSLETSVLSQRFEKDFHSLDIAVQESIINYFDKARKRGLATPFYPDTKIIKDVTPDKSKVKVMELRVYQPVALRVYFSEYNGKVLVGNIEQKSNPNQSDDIKAAHKILEKLI